VTIEVTGSVRVDLVGGTLDLNPINLILKDVVTMNVATSLMAKVKLTKIDEDYIHFISKDYKSENKFSLSSFTKENLSNDSFGPLKFLCQILDYFNVKTGVKIELESGSPAGAGLGGSSAMGVSFFAALCKLYKTPLEPEHAIKVVNSIEAKILDSGPAGYQDYYPALHGGVLALHPSVDSVKVEQLYSEELKKVLEESITLVYSGEQRHSGMNNWEVYKGFFDKNFEMRSGLQEISEISHQAYEALKAGDFSLLLKKISEEGEIRKNQFPGIVTPSMKSLYNNLKETVPDLGMKICGAGGGGCFLLIHDPADSAEVSKAVIEAGMETLEFLVESPL
jgi:D-glycero-alpha-D-manno-heptose-7-phosphate kinase